MLVDARGAPLSVPPMRSAELEAKVNAELQQHCDPSLHIEWVPEVVATPRGREGRYALVCDWHPNDKRNADVPLGYRERWDLLGWFCEDMQNAETVPVAPDAIVAKARELLGRCDNTRDPWRRRIQRAVDHNAELMAQQQRLADDMVADAVGYRDVGQVLIQGGIDG